MKKHFNLLRMTMQYACTIDEYKPATKNHIKIYALFFYVSLLAYTCDRMRSKSTIATPRNEKSKSRYVCIVIEGPCENCTMYIAFTNS